MRSVPVVQWPRTSPFHGGNTGSNPVGDAKKTKDLRDSARKNVGLKRFDKDFRLRETRILLIIPTPRRTHNLPNHSVTGVSLYLHYSLRIHVHRHLEVGVTERFLDRLHVLSVRLHQCAEAVAQRVPATGSLIFRSSFKTGFR